TQQAGCLVVTVFREPHCALLLIYGEIARGIGLAGLLAFNHFAAFQHGNDAVDAVVLVSRFLTWTRDNQWGTGLVDEDGIDLVDNGKVELPLDIAFQPEFHVVAQVVEAELVVCTVGDVGAVGLSPLLLVEVVNNRAHRQAKEAVNPAHPPRVAPGQVIVHGNDVNALAAKRVQIAGQSCDQGFAFAGFHFGDAPAVEGNSADKLNVEVAHIQHAPARFATDRERLYKDVVQAGAIRNALLEIHGLGSQVRVGESLHLRLKIVDRRNKRAYPLDLATMFRAKNLGERSFKHGCGGIYY